MLALTCLFGCSGGARVEPPAASGADDASAETFLAIKRFILAKGDRQTFGNMYNHNPHHAFDGFDAFLIPDVGQKNINCDPALSDFDGMVLRTNSVEGPAYDEVKLDRARGRIVVVHGDEARAQRHLARMRAVATAR
ncbi:MAG: hypothetical protein MUF64_05810 [Polyangiaceae bacterium]|nr:hypothetical protein [Polyangiaceae bacterium]